ncbi:unnamed protein product [marine sediment metagenome]|uniref:Uncharacterized protein n=1 Tax=marine sediment metagenome TaxID=412755 RepID=X1CSZ1_9ZZZZ
MTIVNTDANGYINSLFAIPSMVTILVKGFAIFFPIEPTYESLLSMFVYALIAILYIIGIIGVIMNLRSQGGITNVV